MTDGCFPQKGFIVNNSSEKKEITENRLFRKKSLDRITSPEDIRNYMHISSPRLWMILSAILVLLIGFVVFASITQVENTISGKANIITVTDLEEAPLTILIELPEGMGDLIDVGMAFRINELTGKVTLVIEQDDMTAVSGVFDDPSIMLKPGIYDAEIILERITPFSFLLN